MTTSAIRKLLKKYNQGECTPQEKVLLEKWYEQWQSDGDELDENELQAMEVDVWGKLEEDSKQIPLYRPKRWLTFAAASIVLMAIAFGLYQQLNLDTAQKVIQISDVDPGGNRALLTLANGRQIDLTKLKTGEKVVQNGFKVYKKQDGQLVYQTMPHNEGNATTSSNAVASYNTVTTPKGGQFQVLLADGTKVWLNASSSLRYPVNFIGQERRVELKGEAYFAVAKQEKNVQPFIVNTKYQQTVVLGTDFNINAYDNEGTTKTTLVSGRVKVMTDNTHTRILKPNEQSVVNHQEKQVQVQEANPAEAVAWKDGNFVFNNTNLKTVMREVERWYDVKVVNLESLPNNTYDGKIKRSSKLSKILKILEVTSGVKFSIEAAPDSAPERRLILSN